MPSMSNDEVIALLQAEYQESLGADTASQLRSDRQKALSYYEGDMTEDLPDPVDRSKAVSTDVADTIEGLMPALIEIFASGDEVVVFNPTSEKDVQAAEQETDYINYVAWQQNGDFFITLYSFMKDALLSKVGVVKAWWEEREDETRETYRGMTDDMYALLAADDEIEIIEHSEYQLGQEPGEMEPVGSGETSEADAVPA